MTRTLNPNNKVRLLVLEAFRANPSASLEELVNITGYSKTAVYYHLSNLRNEGVITRDPLPRGLYIRKQRNAKPAKKNSAGDAFRPNAASKKRSAEQERIELVVRMAKEREAAGIIETGSDVFRERKVRRVLGQRL